MTNTAATATNAPTREAGILAALAAYAHLSDAARRSPQGLIFRDQYAPSILAALADGRAGRAADLMHSLADALELDTDALDMDTDEHALAVDSIRDARAAL